jgi:phosphoglycerate kinase
VLGGAKISGKMDVIEQLVPKVDHLLVGGAMACTFFRAMGLETGKSLVEADRVDMARGVLDRAGDKLVLPTDAVVAPALTADAPTQAVGREAIPADQAMFDVGPATVERYAELVRSARTVLWNGPMGVFETPPFDAGTLGVARALAEATAAGATTIVGGGDSAAAIAQAGLETGSRTSPRAAAPRSSSSKARFSPASPRSTTRERLTRRRTGLPPFRPTRPRC